jgi:hypothetical protein
LEHVNILSFSRIKSPGLAALFEKLVNNDGALEASILANGLARDSACLSDNLDTDILVEVFSLNFVK